MISEKQYNFTQVLHDLISGPNLNFCYSIPCLYFPIHPLLDDLQMLNLVEQEIKLFELFLLNTVDSLNFLFHIVY
jgi:hypothetical protein